MDEIATITEFEKKYHDEWVLVEVLEEDEIGRTTKGRLIAHSKARDEIYDILIDTKVETFLFFAGEIPKVINEWKSENESQKC